MNGELASKKELSSGYCHVCLYLVKPLELHSAVSKAVNTVAWVAGVEPITQLPYQVN